MRSRMLIKKRIAFCLALLLLGVLALSYYLYATFLVLEPFASVSSPDGTYQVVLMGQKERPLFFTAEVRFDVLRNGRVFMTNEFLHSGDAFDRSFESGFPDHEWLGENVLHFYRKNDSSPQIEGNLRIVNRTKSKLKYLKVFVMSHKFLVFDILPGSQIDLEFAFQKGTILEVFVKGENFSKGEVFVTAKDTGGPLLLAVSAYANGVKIESPQLKKRR